MSDWFTVGTHGGDPLVFCFAHAGGDARTFLRWQPALAGVATLVAVHPPDRGSDLGTLCDAAADAVTGAAGDRPLVLFGHSLGALLAFEVGRRLGGRPEHLVASGCAAPALLPTPRVVAAARLDGAAFAEAVGFFGGLPPEILADEDLRELLLPGLLADFRMVAGYRYRPAAPLPFGLTLINGRDDPHVGNDSLIQWSNECRAEPARVWADGGHFYFEQHPDAVTGVLRSLALELRGHVELI